jgi:hypothetical protein
VSGWVKTEVRKYIQNEYVRNADIPKLSEIARPPEKFYK